jgi:hypothetical protein
MREFFRGILILTFSPQEKEQQANVFDFSEVRPANPVTRIFKKAV